MQRPNRKPATKEDFLAALDDYKREQDEKTAWNKPPIIDLPKVPPMRRPQKQQS
jgi:hypothetical protein